ncbi:hypothetical protein KW803_02260 [Candidatus Saccharibacteria bacterium]|nr:hypothetical protein [Candidatus Saccharibacteria bacterium]
MSANGHENNGFDQSSEDQPVSVSPAVLNISGYSIKSGSFDVKKLYEKPARPPKKDDLPEYAVDPDCVIDPDRPKDEYIPRSLKTIYESIPVVVASRIEEQIPQIDTDQSEFETILAEEQVEPNLTLPELVAEVEEKHQRRYNVSHRIGVLAAAVSLKLSKLELGKKASEYKQSWVDTANEVSMDLTLKSLSASAALVDIGHKAKLTLENSMKRYSNDSEKGSDNIKVLKYALGAVALVGVTYATYKLGANPFGGNANVAEKTNHTADLFTVVKPTKAPQTEHIQAAQAVISAPAKPEHASNVVQAASAIPHKPNINTNDLPWNVANKVAPNHELEHLNQAMADYSKSINQPVRWDTGSNGIIKVGNHVMNTREEIQLNKILIGLK